MKNFNLCRTGISCTKLTEKISLEELVQIVKDHPEKDLIDVLRSTEYGTDKYKKYKGMLPYVMPHATFCGERRKDNVDQPTGYIYLDIDKKDLPDGSEAMKKTILEKHADKVAVMGTSVGGSGIFIYVKIANAEGLTNENFDSAYRYVRTVLFHDITTDANASGIVRPHYIPADPEVYVNKNAKVLLPDSVLQDKKNISTCIKIPPGMLYQ